MCLLRWQCRPAGLSQLADADNDPTSHAVGVGGVMTWHWRVFSKTRITTLQLNGHEAVLLLVTGHSSAAVCHNNRLVDAGTYQLVQAAPGGLQTQTAVDHAPQVALQQIPLWEQPRMGSLVARQLDECDTNLPIRCQGIHVRSSTACPGAASYCSVPIKVIVTTAGNCLARLGNTLVPDTAYTSHKFKLISAHS
jgi:hypothetical protein